MTTTSSTRSTWVAMMAGIVLVLALAVALLSLGGGGDYNPPSQPVTAPTVPAAPLRTAEEKAEIEAHITDLINALAMARVAHLARDAESLAEWNAEAARLAAWLQEHAPDIGVEFLEEFVLEWCQGVGSEFSVCSGAEEVE